MFSQQKEDATISANRISLYNLNSYAMQMTVEQIQKKRKITRQISQQIQKTGLINCKKTKCVVVSKKWTA